MAPMGKLFIVIGAVFIIVGLLLIFGGKIPYIGRLPGDFRLERENFSLYFPFASCLLVSLLASLLFWLFRR
ncbi:MAG: DUF2905 domain-containing protein [Desulfuromonadales bacterium]